jgi:hypothetical protein
LGLAYHALDGDVFEWEKALRIDVVFIRKVVKAVLGEDEKPGLPWLEDARGSFFQIALFEGVGEQVSVVFASVAKGEAISVRNLSAVRTSSSRNTSAVRTSSVRNVSTVRMRPVRNVSTVRMISALKHECSENEFSKK